MSQSRKVNISKIQVSSNQTYVLAFQDIPGKISMTGKVECIGCTIASREERVTQETDTLLALFVNSVATFAIEEAEIYPPLRWWKMRHAKSQLFIHRIRKKSTTAAAELSTQSKVSLIGPRFHGW